MEDHFEFEVAQWLALLHVACVCFCSSDSFPHESTHAKQHCVPFCHASTLYGNCRLNAQLQDMSLHILMVVKNNTYSLSNATCQLGVVTIFNRPHLTVLLGGVRSATDLNLPTHRGQRSNAFPPCKMCMRVCIFH